MMQRLVRILATSAVMLGSAAAPTLAAAGDLDTSFAGTGIRSIAIAPGSNSDLFEALAVLPSGQLVGAGEAYMGSTTQYDFALARVNTDGSLDSTFDGDGVVTTPVTAGARWDLIHAVALQPDGAVVAAGSTDPGTSHSIFAVGRYTTTGQLDSGFSGDGIQTSAIEGEVRGVAIQLTGKVVVAGQGAQASTADDFALARYTATGAADGGFGSGGTRFTPITAGARDDEPAALALTPGDGIVVAGDTYTGSTNGHEIAVARYTPDGTLDSTFSGDGIQTTEIAAGAGNDSGTAVLVQPDGKIVVAASTESGGGNDDYAVVRYMPNGDLDPSFDGDGIAVTPQAPGDPDAITRQADGKLVVGGSSNGEIGMVRYLPDGTLDPSFGTGGLVFTDSTPGTEYAAAVGIDPAGRVAIAGGGNPGAGGVDSFFGRYLPDPPPPAQDQGSNLPPASTQPYPPGLYPGACANTERGTRKGDRLVGTRAGDRLMGGAGNDKLYGGAGRDCLYGGPGSDLLVGGKGLDKFFAGPGNDFVKAADGVKETIFCGRGHDRVSADRKDRLRGCERVSRHR